MSESLCDSPTKQTGASSFSADVVAESLKRPVLTFFYADDPARHRLAEHLRNAVEATDGNVKLAFLKIDEARQIAGKLGVREAPAVICFAGGRPTDGFMGELPGNQIFTFVERLAGGLVNSEAMIPAEQQDSTTLPLDTGPIADLMLQLDKTPENPELRFRLAVALNETGQREHAAELLLDIVRIDRSWGDDQAGKHLIGFFDVWGPLDPTTVSFRRKLSAVLFN